MTDEEEPPITEREPTDPLMAKLLHIENMILGLGKEVFALRLAVTDGNSLLQQHIRHHELDDGPPRPKAASAGKGNGNGSYGT